MLAALLVTLVGLAAQTVITPPLTPVDLPPVWPGDGGAASTAPLLMGVQGGGSVELGQQVTLTVLFWQPTDVASYAYQWKKGEADIPGATSVSYLIAAAGAADSGTYTVKVTNAAGTSTTGTDVTVKPAAAPVITFPPDGLVRQVGQEAFFGYVATGSYPRTHQWRKNGVDLPGANAATLSIAAVTIEDAGTYSVIVSNNLGSVASESASLTVNAATPIVIYSDSPRDTTVVEGEPAYLTVYFSSGSQPFTYQWRKNGVPIAGATSGQFSLAAAALADEGKYSVTVTNPAGSATSREATLIVTAATPLTIQSQPRDQTVYEGQDASFDVTPSGSQPIAYQWKKNGVPISGATSRYFYLYGATLADAGSYTVTMTNVKGSVTSNAATLTVNRAVVPSIIQQPVGQTLNYGDRFSLSIRVEGSSPFTYQWKKDGVALGSGNSSEYYVYSAKPENSGVYTVVVTNAAGSVTSSEATITVKAAVPPSIKVQPVSQTLAYGESLNLSVEATGSPPLSYQWKKDGVSLSGGSSNYYSVYNATTAASGSYTVVVSNGAGSVTSAAAVVTVGAALAPVITAQPQNQTVPYAETISLSVRATGSAPLRYEWRKDGVSIGSSGSSSNLYLHNATPENSGVYSVIVTNAGGSVTSANATVTVSEPTLPRITEQPKTQSVVIGLEADFSASYASTGAGRVTVQWHKNGVAIAGATSTWWRIASVSATDAGDYTLVLTSPAGIVTSSVAQLLVLPPAAPSVSSWPGDAQARYGETETFSIYSVGGSPPFSYQWFKDGVPIQGAVNASLRIDNATEEDLGVYTVTIANAAGVLGSPPMRLRWSPYDPGVPTDWLDAGRVGDVVYFAATSPARIARYDLAGERWLPTVAVSSVPTAFAVANDGIYLAYERSIVRRSLDLTTETAIANTVAVVKQLFVFGDYLYHNGTGTNGSTHAYASLHRTTLQPGGAVALAGSSNGQRHVAISASLRAAFSRRTSGSPSIVEKFTFSTDGSMISATNSSAITYRYAPARRVYLLPGDTLVADDAGSVYRINDLTFVGSFGSGFDDLALRSDQTTVLLRGNKLTLVPAETIRETNTVTLPRFGQRIFTRGTATFVFGRAETAGGVYTVTKVSADEFKPRATVALHDTPAGRYSVDDAFLGADEAVHVLSRTLGGLVRWSARTRSFLPTVKLPAAPFIASHQPGASRVLFQYPDGLITQVPLGAGSPVEQYLGAMNLRTRAVLDLDTRILLNVAHGQDSGDTRMILGPGAVLVEQPGYGYFGTARAWQAGSRRLYSGGSTYGSGTFQYEIMPENGQLPTSAVSSSVSNLIPPLRFSPDGSLAVSGNGVIMNADLVSVGVLSNNIMDAAWLPDGLYTLREVNGQAEVQRWTGATYLRTGSLPLPGMPVRLFRLSDLQLVAVTSAGGLPLFTVLNQGLTVSTAAASHISVTAPPLSRTVAPGTAVTLSVSHTGTGASPSFRWLRNGVAMAGANQSTLALAAVQPANAGVFTVEVADANGRTEATPAVLAVATAAKVIGAGSEVGPNIVHPNRNVYDQLLLEGAAASLTADKGEVVRISFIDLNDDIVQIEFTGAGTLSLILTGSSGPAAPVNYHQPDVRFMKGHAGIVVTGADETTNVSVFTVGRATAFDPTGAFNLLQPVTAVNDPLRNGSPLFQGHGATAYDGIADLAYIAILSETGRFGGLRAANANFVATAGITGIYAPGVAFAGPVFVGNIDAFGDASPWLMLGSADDVRITGGDLQQTNSRAIKIAGITKLKFVGGTTSHGVALPAQQNRARFDQNGADVTAQIVVNPVVE